LSEYSAEANEQMYGYFGLDKGDLLHMEEVPPCSSQGTEEADLEQDLHSLTQQIHHLEASELKDIMCQIVEKVNSKYRALVEFNLAVQTYSKEQSEARQGKVVEVADTLTLCRQQVKTLETLKVSVEAELQTILKARVEHDQKVMAQVVAVEQERRQYHHLQAELERDREKYKQHIQQVEGLLSGTRTERDSRAAEADAYKQRFRECKEELGECKKELAALENERKMEEVEKQRALEREVALEKDRDYLSQRVTIEKALVAAANENLNKQRMLGRCLANTVYMYSPI